MEEVSRKQLLDADICTSDGDTVGSIEELIIDPNSGLVRFAQVRARSNERVMLPWAAMTFAKSGGSFTLTSQGEHLWQRRLEEQRRA